MLKLSSNKVFVYIWCYFSYFAKQCQIEASPYVCQASITLCKCDKISIVSLAKCVITNFWTATIITFISHVTFKWYALIWSLNILAKIFCSVIKTIGKSSSSDSMLIFQTNAHKLVWENRIPEVEKAYICFYSLYTFQQVIRLRFTNDHKNY